MSLGIDTDAEVIPFQVTLMDNEVLRVTPDGQFVWHPNADRMIEEGDFSHSPAIPFILRALRKREWQGLTDEEVEHIADSEWEEAFVRLVEAKLKEKNDG